MLSRLRKILSERPKLHIVGTDRPPAAVLIPIYQWGDDYYVIFTQRTHTVSTHKGHISFPGGTREKNDASLLDTALRECAEEVGIARATVDILGELDDCRVYFSNYVISPFVGVIPWPYIFTVSETETAEIIQAPISELLDDKCMSEGSEIIDGEPVPAYFYTYRGKMIWGATARILKQFLDIWQLASSGPHTSERVG